MPNSLLPCPYCGGNNLTTNNWIVKDSEEEAIECANCYGSNLRKNWNNRKSEAIKIPCHDEVPLFSLCAGIVTKTAPNSVQITDTANKKYIYNHIDHGLKIDQIIEVETHIGFSQEGNNYVELQVSQ